LYFRTLFIPQWTYVIGLRLDNGLHKYSANSSNSHVYLICNTLGIRSDQRTGTMQNVSIAHKTSKGYFPLPRKTCHFSFRTAEILNTLCKLLFQRSQWWFIQYDILLLQTQDSRELSTTTHTFLLHPSTPQMTTLCNGAAETPMT